MKNTKKLFALMLAVLMLLSVYAVAWASETENSNKYKITINEADAGHTYEAYQIFKGDLSEGGVLSNIEKGNGVKDDILNFNGTEYDTAAALAEALTEANKVAFADHAAANLATVAGTSKAESDGTYTISGLEPGYYLIKDQDDSIPDGHAYTRFIAKVVGNVEATPKTDKTTLVKKVFENVKEVTDGKMGAAGYKYNDVADYNIGDTVPFALYSTVPDLTHYPHYTMIFHDKMSAGLTFESGSVKVTVGDKPLVNGEDFSVTTPGSDGCTFEVKIFELVGKDYQEGDEIRVDYNATLNSSAVVGLPGNPNESQLEFTNNPNTADEKEGEDFKDEDTTKTPWDNVVVFTYELDVTKVDGADTTKTLQGAKFVLKNENDKFAKLDDEKKINSWVDSQSEATVLTSGADGIFTVIGLDDGTYTLEEIKAPEGYNKLANPIRIVISATTVNDQNYSVLTDNVGSNALTALKIQLTEGTNYTEVEVDPSTGIVSATVKNNQGATLPETGGIGTTIFYVAGGVLVLLAVVLLVTKRRVGEN